MRGHPITPIHLEDPAIPPGAMPEGRSAGSGVVWGGVRERSGKRCTMDPHTSDTCGEQLTRLRLLENPTVDALLQEAAVRTSRMRTSSRPGAGAKSRRQNRKEHHHAHRSRPLPVREGHRTLRLYLSALAGRKHPAGGDLSLHRARREHRHSDLPASAKPPGDWAGAAIEQGYRVLFTAKPPAVATRRSRRIGWTTS